jgi:ribonucleoside-diphosphate reductase alpha chain
MFEGFGSLARSITLQKYSHEQKEDWPDVAERTVRSVVDPYQQFNNCFLFRAEDSREGWADLSYKVHCALMTGGGIGVDYSNVRPANWYIGGMGGQSTGPIALMNIQNEAGRYIRQGGSRRSAIWAGLKWWHPDIFAFIEQKNWPQWLKVQKDIDFNTPCPMDGTNISVQLDDDFFEAFVLGSDWRKTYTFGKISFTVDGTHARRVFWAVVHSGCMTGEPGFSIDCGTKVRETLRNACTEVTSEDDSDMCNLGSINMARVESIDEFREIVEIGTAFLMCGTLCSKLPVPKMYDVREKNRRLGLGLMGVHEWLLKRSYKYEPNPELGRWLEVYLQSTEFARKYSQVLSCSDPIATRSIAPNGTIGIVGETTTAAEPIEAVAYLRRFLKNEVWHAQYTVSPTAKRLIESGINPNSIETAYSLSQDVGRRVKFQEWLQGYVDHAISSTINMPPWGNEYNNQSTITSFGNTLLESLPKLRGITVYPDGARGGQPIVPVDYHEAIGKAGVEFIDNGSACASGVCGS